MTKDPEFPLNDARLAVRDPSPSTMMQAVIEKGITLGDAAAGGYLYHDPCHTPMILQDPMKTVKALVGANVL